jgi:transposase-like protein/very-short-patch-repair endonuclease
MENEIEFIIESDEENELTTYSYISNHLCFEYFVGYQITSLLGYKNPAQTIGNNVSKCNQLFFREYPGVKEPELDPRTVLINRDGAIELVIKTRKRISPDVLYILKKFNINTTNMKCLSKEQQTLSIITNTFKTETFEDQYKVGKYYLDLYFPEYKIVIECDENGHADRKPHKERERMDFVNEKLGLEDSNWIRYNPDEKDFDLSKVMGKIYRFINQYKEKLFEEAFLKENKKNKIKEERKILDESKIDLENGWWALEIADKGKYKTPPKDMLIEKLKTNNISNIAHYYGISTNPVAKWVKEYDIDIKEFKNELKVPTKDELIEHFKNNKSQTDIANHYNVSRHIIRKWLKSYDLSTNILKFENSKKIDKKELVNIVDELKGEKQAIAEKLNISTFNVEKLIKINNIKEIPSKEELKIHLENKTKEEIAELYKTCRTTLRKWLRFYDLENTRCSIKTNRPVEVINSENVIIQYKSVSDLCKDLHISHSKLYEYVDTEIKYKGNIFKFYN